MAEEIVHRIKTIHNSEGFGGTYLKEFDLGGIRRVETKAAHHPDHISVELTNDGKIIIAINKTKVPIKEMKVDGRSIEKDVAGKTDRHVLEWNFVAPMKIEWKDSEGALNELVIEHRFQRTQKEIEETIRISAINSTKIQQVLTEPVEGTQNNFIYLVHAMPCAMSAEEQSAADKRGAPRFKEVETEELIARVKRVLDPESFYSASLIGKLDEKTAKEKLGLDKETEWYGTDGGFGLIIKPSASEQIRVAWPADIFSPDSESSREKMTNFLDLHRGKVKSPAELLTKATIFNELIISGDANPGQIVGVFKSHNFHDDGLTRPEGIDVNATKLQKVLKDKFGVSVPIIEIPRSSREYYGWQWGLPTDENDKLVAEFDDFVVQQKLTDEQNLNGIEVSKLPNAKLVYKLPIKTAVEFAVNDGIIATKEGQVPYTKGDAIMTGVEGEKWPIMRAKFEATYEPAEGQSMWQNGKYAKKRIDVYAAQMDKPFTVNVSWQNAPLHGKEGDWLVQYGKSSYGIVSKDIFAKTYVEAK